MKYLNVLFGISFLGAGVLGGCANKESPADDGSGSGASTPGKTNILDDSERLVQAEIERRTNYLASPELQGRAPMTEGGLMARQYIIDEMNACGIQPLDPNGFEQPIATLAGAANVLGYVAGTDAALKERYVMLSAHYDHLGVRGIGEVYIGADDNAAAVAVALAVGCAIADSPQPRSVIIAAWDAEEPPFFLREGMGSQYYVDNPVVPLAQTDANIVLELIGSDFWPGFNNHMLLGAEMSTQLQAAVDASPVPEGLIAFSLGLHLAEEQPLGIGRQPWSDYNAFRNAGIPTMMMSNGQTKRYHTVADTADTLNYWKVALEAKLHLRIVSRLANAVDNPVFVDGGADYARDAASVARVLEFALAPGGIVDALGLAASTATLLQGDLAEIQAISAKMTAGTALSEAEVRRLRDGAQRMMCLAGSTYTEDNCSLF